MQNFSRREFMATMAVAAVPSAAAPKLSFSTLGCPGWNWPTILENAVKFGFNGIELRGILREMDLTKVPEFAPDRIKQSKAELAEEKLGLAGLGASAQMHDKEGAARTAQLDEGKRFIDLAQRLGAPYVRVFGNKFEAGEQRQAVLDRVVAGLTELGRHARGSGVTVLLESHGDFYESATLRALMDRVGMDTVALLWDVHATCVNGHEKPADSWAAIGKYVRHVHLKDSIPKGNDTQYVLTGQGTLPIREIVQLLKANGYQGYYNLEWEKTWIPDLQDPEVVFPHFARTIREYLRG